MGGCLRARPEVQLRHRDTPDIWLAFSSWWTIAVEQIAALDAVEQEMVTHACEQETSMVLRLRPELVKPEVACGTNIPFDSAFYCPDFSRPNLWMVERADEAQLFEAARDRDTAGTAEKGEALFATAVREVVAFVREFATWPTLPPQ